MKSATLFTALLFSWLMAPIAVAEPSFVTDQAFSGPELSLDSQLESSPVNARPYESKSPQITEASPSVSPSPTRITQANSPASTDLAKIIGVKLSPRRDALEIVLELESGQVLQVETAKVQTSDTSLILEIPGAVLALPDQADFRAENPTAEIATVQVNQHEGDRLQVRVTGTQRLPQKRVILTAGGESYLLNPIQTAMDDEAEEITVTGTRTARPVRLTPGSIAVIDGQEIDQRLVRDLRDLFQYEPNVSVGNNRRYGLQDINIRGLGGNRVLIQNDGIRIPTQFQFGTPSLGRDYVELETLQRAEVIRGPASALYGSDALGGVVSFRSLDPSDLLDRFDRQESLVLLSSNAETTDQSWVNTGSLAFRSDALEGLFTYTRRDGLESRLPDDNEFVDARENRRNNWLGKFAYRFNDKSRLMLTTEFFRNNDEFRVAPITAALLLGPAGFRGQDESLETETNRDRVSLSYQYEDPESRSFLKAARLQIYSQNSEVNESRTQDFIRTGTGSDRRRVRRLDNNFSDRILGADIQLQSNFNLGTVANQLTYGFDISRTENERTRDGLETRFNAAGLATLTTNVVGSDNFPVKDFPDSSTFRLGLYVQNEMEFGDRFTLIPGLRFDHYRLNTEPDALYERNPGATASDLESSALSPSLGIVWQATPELAVVGRYARGFRSPLYSEINSGFTNLTSPFFRYKTLSNPDLKPETSDTFELGIRGNYSQLSFSATGFYNHYNDFIESFAAAGVDRTLVPGAVVNLFQTQNVAEARTYGFELSGEYRFSPQAHGFSLLAGLGLTVGDNLTTDQPLETVDPFKAVLGFRYRAPEDRWGAELIATLVGKPRLADNRPAGSYTPEGYTVLDLVGYYNVTPLIRFNAGIFNLLNNQYALYSDVRSLINSPTPADIGRFAQPGISFRAGLTVGF